MSRTGREDSSEPEMAWPMLASVVLMAAACGSTVTTSAAVPASRRTSNVVVVPTRSSRCWRTLVLKPCALTSILYLPGKSWVKTYLPSPSVLAFRVAPLASLVTLIWAPATLAPLESRTVPDRPADCDQAGRLVANRTSANTHTYPPILRVFTTHPHEDTNCASSFARRIKRGLKVQACWSDGRPSPPQVERLRGLLEQVGAGCQGNVFGVRD